MSVAERELRIDRAPVVIGESVTDPGSMGEPFMFESDGTTYVTVPPASWWTLGELIEPALIYLDRFVSVDDAMADGFNVPAWIDAVRAMFVSEAET